MSWWQVAILVYFMLTPWSQIGTIMIVGLLLDDRKTGRAF